MSDIQAMLAGFENAPLWRAAMADYVSDRWLPAQAPVELHELPSGFHRRFTRRSVPRLKAAKPRIDVPGGPLNKGEIGMLLRGALSHRFGALNVFDHMGATQVLGVPVLVGEPYPTTEDLGIVAAGLTDLFGFPVSHHREAAWSESCIRFCVWFQFDA